MLTRNASSLIVHRGSRYVAQGDCALRTKRMCDMKEPLISFAGPLGNLLVDVDISRVANFPPKTLNSSGKEAATVEGPVLVLPVDALSTARIEETSGTRCQLNAAVVDGVLFPLVAVHVGDLAVGRAFEPTGEDEQQQNGAANAADGCLCACTTLQRRYWFALTGRRRRINCGRGLRA
jgi:hypothetical protein